MKKNTQILKTRPKLSLGDLILAVSSCTKNTKETVAAVADLLGSGQVRVESNGTIPPRAGLPVNFRHFKRPEASLTRLVRSSDVSFSTNRFAVLAPLSMFAR